MTDKEKISKLKDKYCERIWHYLLHDNSIYDNDLMFDHNVKVLESLIEIEHWVNENG